MFTFYTGNGTKIIRYVIIIYFHKSKISCLSVGLHNPSSNGCPLQKDNPSLIRLLGHVLQCDNEHRVYVILLYHFNIIIKQVICIKKTSSTISKTKTKTSSTAKTKTMSEDSF